MCLCFPHSSLIEMVRKWVEWSGTPGQHLHRHVPPAILPHTWVCAALSQTPCPRAPLRCCSQGCLGKEVSMCSEEQENIPLAQLLKSDLGRGPSAAGVPASSRTNEGAFCRPRVDRSLWTERQPVLRTSRLSWGSAASRFSHQVSLSCLSFPNTARFFFSRCQKMG